MVAEASDVSFDGDLVNDTNDDADGTGGPGNQPFEPLPLYDEVDVPPPAQRDRSGDANTGDRGEARRGVVIIDLVGDDDDDADATKKKPVVIDLNEGHMQF